MFVSAIVTAAGSGLRFGGQTRKQFTKLAGKPLLYHSLEVFLGLPQVKQVIVVLPPADFDLWLGNISSYFAGAPLHFCFGGETRQRSVFNGLQLCNPQTEFVMIHDGVRPLLKADDVMQLLQAAVPDRNVIPVTPVRYTVKQVVGNRVVKTIPRDDLVNVHTPQLFSYNILKDLHERAKREQIEFTDDAGILEHYGVMVHTVECHLSNIKVTTPDDLALAEFLLHQGKDNPND